MPAVRPSTFLFCSSFKYPSKWSNDRFSIIRTTIWSILLRLDKVRSVSARGLAAPAVENFGDAFPRVRRLARGVRDFLACETRLCSFVRFLRGRRLRAADLVFM